MLLVSVYPPLQLAEFFSMPSSDWLLTKVTRRLGGVAFHLLTRSGQLSGYTSLTRMGIVYIKEACCVLRCMHQPLFTYGTPSIHHAAPNPQVRQQDTCPLSKTGKEASTDE